MEATQVSRYVYKRIVKQTKTSGKRDKSKRTCELENKKVLMGLEIRSHSNKVHSQIYLFIYLFKLINLFLAAQGLCCCAQAFSSCGERGLLFVAVRWLLIAVASPAAEHGLQVHGLQQLWHAGSKVQAQQLWCTGLVAPRHVGSSRTRARTRVPCIGRRILNHCTTREVPLVRFKASLNPWPGLPSSSIQQKEFHWRKIMVESGEKRGQRSGLKRERKEEREESREKRRKEREGYRSCNTISKLVSAPWH